MVKGETGRVKDEKSTVPGEKKRVKVKGESEGRRVKGERPPRCSVPFFRDGGYTFIYRLFTFREGFCTCAGFVGGDILPVEAIPAACGTNGRQKTENMGHRTRPVLLPK